MSHPYTTVDNSGRFLASVIPKQGRNEVQFYAVSENPSTLIEESKVSRHELQVDSDIVAVTWLNEKVHGNVNSAVNSGAKNGKKRPNPTDSSQDSANGATTQSAHANQASLLLAVALSSGEIWTFSPQSDMPVAQIEAPEPVLSMTASATANRVWALTESGSVYEINVLDAEPTKTIRFGKWYPDVTMIGACNYKPKKRRNAQADPELFFLASSHLYMVDGAKSRAYVAAEFNPSRAGHKHGKGKGKGQIEEADEHEEDEHEEEEEERKDKKAPVTHIHTVSADGHLVVVARARQSQSSQSSSPLELYDITDSKKQPVLLHCVGQNVHGLRSLNHEYIVAHTEIGAELFALSQATSTASTKNPKQNKISPVATVSPDVQGLTFEHLYWSAAHGVVGVFYDGLQAQFARVADDAVFAGSYTVPVEYTASEVHDQTTQGNGVSDITFTAGEGEEELAASNLPANKLFTELAALLLATPVDSSAVVALCKTYSDDSTVKDTVRHFAYSEHYIELVETMFTVVSARVARDPSQKSPLSVWLRWMLLAHGGHLATQKQFVGSLRSLQQSLDEGMSLMPKLLALQGRLQLLKAQAELRNAVANGEFGQGTGSDAEADTQQRELEALNETTFNNTTTNIEESVVYANGENDDLDEFVDAVSVQPDESQAQISFENGEAEADDSE